MVRTSSRRTAALAVAAALLVGVAPALLPRAADAATLGSLTVTSEVDDGVWNSQDDTIRFASSAGCPAPATNVQIRVYGTKAVGGNVFAPVPPAVDNVDTDGDGAADNFAPNIQGNTSQSTVGGSVQAGPFSGPVAQTLAGFAVAQAQPGGYLPAGTYGMQLVCRTAGNSTSLGEFTIGFTVTGSGASSVVAVRVPPAPAAATATVITTSPAGSAAAGTPVTLTATVSAVGSATVPTGTVQFTADGAAVGAPQAVGGTGVATLTTTALPGGSVTLAARYVPATAAFLGSASTGIPFQVLTLTTATTLTTSPAGPVAAGTPVTLTATVAVPAAPGTVPTGTVQFRRGAATLGAPAPLGPSGAATLTTTALPVGTSSLTAQFVPAGPAYLASTSSAVALVVELNATTTTLTVGPTSPVVGGSPVTLTATVANAADGGPTPSGSVQFVVDGEDFGRPVVLSAAGVAVLTTTGLQAGALDLGATYVPASTAFTASSAATVPFVVLTFSTTLDLAASPSGTVAQGDEVTLTATVTVSSTPVDVAASSAAVGLVRPLAAPLVGGVQFTVDDRLLGAVVPVDGEGMARLAVRDLPAGSLTLGARFLPGSTGLVASTAASGVTITVTAASDDDPRTAPDDGTDQGGVATGAGGEGLAATGAPTPGPALTGATALLLGALLLLVARRPDPRGRHTAAAVAAARRARCR